MTESSSLTVVDGARPMVKPSAELAAIAYSAILDGTPPPEIGDPEISNRAVLEDIISAESFEDVFAAQSLPAWSEYALDKPVTVFGFHLNPSSFEGGSSVYAVVEIADPDDEGLLRRVTVGGQKVLVQLIKGWEHGWFPLRLKLTEKQTRTEGRKVLGLEFVDGAERKAKAAS